MIEGTPPGTYVRTLVAVDTKDAVSGYALLDDGEGHFSIDNYTGQSEGEGGLISGQSTCMGEGGICKWSVGVI